MLSGQALPPIVPRQHIHVDNSPPPPPARPDGPPEWLGQNLYLRPSYIVSLPEYANSTRCSSLSFIKNQENLKDRSHKGLLSNKAIGKMKNAINWLLSSAEPKKVWSQKYKSWFKFKVNFITLTLPDTKNEITNEALQKNLLNPFLTHLRSKYDLNNYVWKLEFQKNGKLHVHFTTDTFIHHRVLRSVWNRLLITNGYMVEFAAKFGHTDPNSTDVHSVKKIRNLGAYLCKYMSKQDADLAKIKGRIWGCSQSLSRANETKMHVWPPECAEILSPLMNSGIRYKEIGSVDKITGELRPFGEIFFLQFADWSSRIDGAIRSAFLEVINSLRPLPGSLPEFYTV